MSFCAGLNAKLKHAINEFDDFLDQHIGPVLQITGAIRSALQSPIAVIITDLIPGQWDDNLRTLALKALDVAIGKLSVVSKCESCTTTQEKLECYIAELKTYMPDKQDADIFKLASLIIGDLHGNSLSRSMYDLFVQTKVVADK
jgi:hypothetical protein